MLANLMEVAGMNHLVTIDLHASQSQGFFKCPVDNLIAEPTIAKWIKGNVQDWRRAVVVSKNPGGTKRVTALADALQLSFGIVTTERRRPYYPQSMENSTFLAGGTVDGSMEGPGHGQFEHETEGEAQIYSNEPSGLSHSSAQSQAPSNGTPQYRDFETGANRPSNLRSGTTLADGESNEHDTAHDFNNLRISTGESDLLQPPNGLRRTQTALGTTTTHPDLTYGSDADDDNEEYNDEVGEILTVSLKGLLTHYSVLAMLSLVVLSTDTLLKMMTLLLQPTRPFSAALRTKILRKTCFSLSFPPLRPGSQSTVSAAPLMPLLQTRRKKKLFTTQN